MAHGGSAGAKNNTSRIDERRKQATIFRCLLGTIDGVQFVDWGFDASVFVPNESAITPIAAKVDEFLLTKPNLRHRIQTIVPMPPSKTSRKTQPVLEISRALGSRLQVPVETDAIRKNKETPQLKNISDYEQRIEMLDDVFEVDSTKTAGKELLLLDDLYRSGATANAVAFALYRRGQAASVYFIALTRTRSFR